MMNGHFTIPSFVSPDNSGAHRLVLNSGSLQLVPMFAATPAQDALARDRAREMERLLNSGQNSEGLSGVDGQTGYFLLFILMIIGTIVILRRTIDT